MWTADEDELKTENWRPATKWKVGRVNTEARDRRIRYLYVYRFKTIEEICEEVGVKKSTVYNALKPIRLANAKRLAWYTKLVAEGVIFQENDTYYGEGVSTT